MIPLMGSLNPKECQGGKVRAYVGHSTVTRVRLTR